MFRNNLFIKICLSFWVTTLFMIGGILMLDWLTGSGPFRTGPHPMPGPPMDVHGQSMAWIYQHEGRRAAENFAAQLRESTGIRIVLLDKNGMALTGLPGAAEEPQKVFPPDGEKAAGRHFEEERNWQRVRVKGPEGELSALVAQTPGRPPLPPGGPDSWTMVAMRLLVVLMVSGLVCYLLARYLTSPILKLGTAARQLAAGDLSVRVAPSIGRRKDEIALLALDFDGMAERIESLLNSQRKLLRDISHELRSPLARLNVALELCRKGSKAELERFLVRIGRESDRLNEMIGHLLTLSRVESGIATLEKKRIDLTKLLREIAEDSDFEAQGLGRGVTLDAQPACFVEGDEELLRQAIGNVARNAVRYTQEGSDVEISLGPADPPGRKVVVIVRDHGPGVPEEALPHLFTPFYRVSDSRERETGGTGLGLAISESAVRLHGGTILAANAPGGGLIVEIVLPLFREG
ncbi:two-component system, OmpR family, sensor histidine kinase CpxA [Syntrophus gentianae]|uniref:histidine kinase n=1 Tax=Syntrophus gentianae TaxID=43775 RepID=A0A1H7YT64_9BACT|nr:ATP-binding protein [Syntrophus gentianae]SEM49155.1 two-component system, OmpR family, sensor histidine kinase CpxA [Syntrophus gentianae]